MIAMTLAARFALEVAGLVGAAYAASQLVDGPLRWPAAVAAPVALAVLWGLVVAPKATNALTPTVRALIGTAILVGVAALVAAAGRPGVALTFAALVLANGAMLTASGALATVHEVTR